MISIKEGGTVFLEISGKEQRISIMTDNNKPLKHYTFEEVLRTLAKDAFGDSVVIIKKS